MVFNYGHIDQIRTDLLGKKVEVLQLDWSFGGQSFIILTIAPQSRVNLLPQIIGELKLFDNHSRKTMVGSHDHRPPLVSWIFNISHDLQANYIKVFIKSFAQGTHEDAIILF